MLHDDGLSGDAFPGGQFRAGGEAIGLFNPVLGGLQFRGPHPVPNPCLDVEPLFLGLLEGDGDLPPGQEHQDPISRLDINIRDLVARGRDAGGGGLTVTLRVAMRLIQENQVDSLLVYRIDSDTMPPLTPLGGAIFRLTGGLDKL